MRIVAPEDSFKIEERISLLKFLYHDWFGFRCPVNRATLYSDKGDKTHEFKYSDCYLTLSKNILSLKDHKGFIWKVKVRLLELKEGEKASVITFVDQYDQRFSLKTAKWEWIPVTIFEFSPFGTPSVTLTLNSTAFHEKVFRYFRTNAKNLKPNSKEVLLSALKEAEGILNNDSFSLIKIHFEKAIQKDSDKIFNWIKEYNSSPLSWIYSKTSNISGDMVESGEYHIYQNALNDTGQKLLKLFDDSTDKLCEQGDIKKDYADSQKKNIREYIKGIG